MATIDMVEYPGILPDVEWTKMVLEELEKYNELDKPSGVIVTCVVCGAEHEATNGELLGVANPQDELWICPECE